MIRAALVVLVSACALTSKAAPREVRHFAPVIAAESKVSTTPCARVRLGRVVPSATLRLAIVRRISPVEIEAHETLRWTEPPEAYARRALANELFATHALEQAVTGPATVLDVELQAFEEIGPGAARVELRYELRDDHRVIARGTSRVERTATTPSIEAFVAAIGIALAAASDEVAERVVVAICRTESRSPPSAAALETASAPERCLLSRFSPIGETSSVRGMQLQHVQRVEWARRLRCEADMAQALTVVVTGSTGKQGGAVARGLLERGHKVRAVTRDPDSSQARSLASSGATLVPTSPEDTAAITKALEGATSLFAMTTPAGPGAELRQGIAAADAAKAAGVHLVFTSVGSANRQTGVPHFDSKYEVEQHIAKIGVRATILAPVYFMENLYFGKEQLAKGVYAGTLPPTRTLAQITVADIGAVAVSVLEDAGRFTGKRFDLAGDELTGNDVVAILSRVTGRPFTYFQVPLEVIRQRMGEDGARMYEWMDRVGYTVDRVALRREFPDVAFHDFESWVKKQEALLQSARST